MYNHYKRNNYLYKLIILLLSVSLFSCNHTKYLKKNEYLLKKNIVKIVDLDKNAEKGYYSGDIEALIRPKTNSKFLWMRINLGVYNFYSPQKTKIKEKKLNDKCKDRKDKKYLKYSKKAKNYEKIRSKFKKGSKDYIKYDKKLKYYQKEKDRVNAITCDKKLWTRRIGEKPALYSEHDVFRNKKQIRIYFKKKGYFFPKITDSIVKKKEYKVIYKIEPGKPYIINEVTYNIEDSLLKINNPNISKKSILKKGKRLDVDLFQAERQRITDSLRNAGYYMFTNNYINYTIDTLQGNNTANVIVNIIKFKNYKGETSLHKKYYINRVNIYPNFDPKKALTDKENYFKNFVKIDTFCKNSHKFYFYYKQQPRLSTKSITLGTDIFPDSVYNLKSVKKSYKYLSSLKIIKIANVNFEEKKLDEITDTTLTIYKKLKEQQNIGFLDCTINLTQGKLQSYTFEIEGTNTSGNLGASGNILYSHKNIFHNAEILDLKLKAAVERQINLVDKLDNIKIFNGNFFNSRELGVDLSIKFPRLFMPERLKFFIKRFNPQTVFTINYNNLLRPDYTRIVAGFSYGYYWKTSEITRHIFRPAILDFVELKDATDEFLAYINRLHLNETYEDHFILGIGYSIIINNQKNKNYKKNFTYIRINGKSAGNLLNLGMKLAGAEKVNGSYMLANNVFAQFVKADIDFRYYRALPRAKDKLVFRTFFGVAYPYGNVNVIPFGEKYFSGGANGIRAWNVRSLGPGTYSLTDKDVYPNQTADIKIEANFEYRMKLFWMLEGAMFLDAGNIWAINDEDKREGAIFDFSTFYKQIALGTGLGVRLNFDFFIIRFDFGFKVVNPALPEGSRFMMKSGYFNNDVWAFNIGIGYPF